MSIRKVVITGIGIVSSLGVGKNVFWEALVTGKSGVKEINQFSTTGLLSHKAAWVDDFETGIPPMVLRRLDRPTRMVAKATALAIDDSKLNIKIGDTEAIDENFTNEIGLIVNTTFGPVSTNEKYILTMLKDGPEGASPALFTGTVTNGPAGFAATVFKLRGLSSVLVGASSVSYACDLIKAGRANCILAGGFEEITETVYSVASELEFIAKSTDNVEENSYPYDKRRNGFVLGEGCVILTLENAEHALARGAEIYAEIASHITLYDPQEDSKLLFRGLSPKILKLAMQNALDQAACKPFDIDGIFGLAMSSPEVDIAEADALWQVFGEHLKKIPISAIKGALGETIGMAGAAGIASGAMAIRHNIMPSTINWNYPTQEINSKFFENKSDGTEIKTILCNSMELSGNDIVHILKRF